MAVRPLVRACALGALWLAASVAAAAAAPQASARDAAPLLRAVRTTSPVVVDGRLADGAWALASAATEFRQRDPQEGAAASERTEVRVLYDDEAIYVGIRMFDREPGLVTRRLSRRDDEADADRVIVFLDPRHDHLTGASFELTAAGVQSDAYLYDDTRDDDAWDAVWAGRVSTDAQGWSAEMRIPYSQLRFPKAESHTWGVNVERVIRRKNENAWLVLTPKKERGLVSRMAHLTGIDGIAPKAHLELLPYAVSRAELVAPSSPGSPFNDGSRMFGAAGLDLKWGITSGFTLDATVNPDFGQVELDPAVINLTAFETFFEEKRPFFTEGAQIFTNFGELGGGGAEVPDLFYSRRIGREPQGSAPGDHVDRPRDADVGLRRETRGFDDRLTRGGPAGVRPAGWDLSCGIGSDSRKPVSFDVNAAHEWNEAGGWESQFELSLNLKASRRLTLSTGPEITHSRDVAQYITSKADALASATYGRRYLFGELDQTELSMQTRVNLLLTPTMSLQVYAQPLVGVGRYGAIKEFARPGTFDFLRYGTTGGTLSCNAEEGEYDIDPDGSGPAKRFTLENPDFNEKSLRLQAVFRWEWRPGSTLYVVWTEEREDESFPGRFDLSRDVRRLLRAPADDVFAVKISYWLGR
jgi:hypothetical protein